MMNRDVKMMEINDLKDRVDELERILANVKIILGVQAFIILILLFILGYSIAEHLQDVAMLKELISK